MTPEEKIKAWNLVESLRALEGDTVTLICDNPDFNGQPNNAVECCGDWTGWDERRFTGGNILEALQAARAARLAIERDAIYGGMDD